MKSATFITELLLGNSSVEQDFKTKEGEKLTSYNSVYALTLLSLSHAAVDENRKMNNHHTDFFYSRTNQERSLS